MVAIKFQPHRLFVYVQKAKDLLLIGNYFFIQFKIIVKILFYYLHSTPKFILPGVAGSPPKVLTMDEVQKVITSVDNMTLAHEIAINPDFRLQPYEPPENRYSF